MNSLSAKTHKSVGNSNNYGQLMSIKNKVNYIRDGKVRQRLVEKSINYRRRKPTPNGRIRQSTINSHRQSSTIASRFTYLLSAASLSTFNLADSIKRYSTINNYRQSKTTYPKIKDRKIINNRKRNWTGYRGAYLFPATMQ